VPVVHRKIVQSIMPPVLQASTDDVTRPAVTERPPIRVVAVDAGRVVAELVVTRVAVESLVPTTCAGALCCNGTLLCAADVADDLL
jgi:hypothetical protein